MRAFTLLELLAVIASISVMAAIAVPSYAHLVARSRASEAHAMLEAIAHAELLRARDRGAFVACPPAPAAVPRGGRAPFASACFAELGITVGAPVHFQYAVETDARSFSVVARGDLDGDGVTSLWRLDGRTLQLAVEQELE